VSSSNRTRNCEVSCLLRGDSEGEKRPLARRTSLLDSVKLPLGTRASPPVLLDFGDDNSDDRPTGEWKVLSPYIFVCHAVLFVNLTFSRSKYIVWDHPSHINITFLGKSMSTFVISELKTR
jgi:hypothetical protein